MALTPGTRLGPYEVLAQIGVGGMGEVYRATDTNLKRQVAIKVLPESVAADTERLARFQREAEVLAALNHPNIAAIYGLERSGSMTALVMELVEGPTLAEQIAGRAGPSGPAGLPIDEALPIAKQIAEALEAAHEQGIVHRDLKPANIKVRPDGTVKVLDFGLAKAMEPAGSASANASMSPTITSPAMMTGIGMILGTAAYMSPEQARGKTVDKRADIWAFGAVLYEMLTGKRAFEDEDVSMTLSKVLQREPDFDALPPSVPGRVRQVLRVCLRKDAKQRVGDIRDVRLALEGAFETAVPLTTSPAPSGRLAWMAFAAAVLAAAGLSIPAVRHLSETPPPETRLEVTTPPSGDPSSFALSPDGTQLVFVAGANGRSQLWLRSLGVMTTQQLAGTEGALAPFWSPDSRSVAFFAEGALKRLELGGGQPRILTMPAAPNGGTWNSDGVILFQRTLVSGPLFQISAEGGEPVPATTLNRQSRHDQPFFLPDGKHFLFHSAGGIDTRGIFLGSLDSKTATRLLGIGSELDQKAAYVKGGWVTWIQGERLVAQRLDLANQILVGRLVTLADSASAVSVSAQGVIAYRPRAASRRRLHWFNRAGEDVGALGMPDADQDLSNPRVSPDGRRVVVRRQLQGNGDLWLLEGTRTTRFTFDPASDDSPTWSPDGTRILFRSQRTSPSDLYVKAAKGGAAETLLFESPLYKTPSDWSADGRFILYHSRDPQTDMDIWVLPLDGDRKPWLFLKTRFNERHGNLSPDGRWVAYMSNESGRAEIYVRPFVAPGSRSTGTGEDASGGQWQLSTTGGIFPRWARDGRELYYIGPGARMMAVPLQLTGATLDPGEPIPLFETRIAEGGEDVGQGPMFDVSADGRFLITTDIDETAAPITLLMNWTPPDTK